MAKTPPKRTNNAPAPTETPAETPATRRTVAKPQEDAPAASSQPPPPPAKNGNGHNGNGRKNPAESMVQDVVTSSYSLYEELLEMQMNHIRKMQSHLTDSLPWNYKGTMFARELMTAFQQMVQGAMENPHEYLELQSQYLAKGLDLWKYYLSRMEGQPDVKPVVEPPKGDKRFSGEAWQQYPFYDYLKQLYLLSASYLQDMVKRFPPDDPSFHKKVNYQLKQLVEAMAPSNFPYLNPEVMKTAIETNGESLAKGYEHFLHDMNEGRVTMTDMSAFTVGENLATTPGQVVFQNKLIQIIQYTPTTEKVYEYPLLIMPPWINKFYILDLQAENSFVKYAVEQGHTVFMVSWRNIPADMDGITWDDYLSYGSMTAIDVVKTICRVPKINIIGYCIGGTLLACTLSILKTRKKDYINSATFFTAMVDFSDTGEISVFVDEQTIKEKEEMYQDGGIFGGNAMANSFAMLRPNDLIWQYWVNNYLLGKDYTPFDLLYWNGDPTNMAGAQYMYYLRNMYLENNLAKPGKLNMLGTPIDVTKIDVPVISIAAREDHIAPCHTVYKSVQLFSGPKEFVLGASGHIAGVVNPPAKKKREFWHSGPIDMPFESWLANAKQEPGSWWTYWAEWMKEYGGKQVPARTELGSEEYKPLEPAPGYYVKESVPVSAFRFRRLLQMARDKDLDGDNRQALRAALQEYFPLQPFTAI